MRRSVFTFFLSWYSARPRFLRRIGLGEGLFRVYPMNTLATRQVVLPVQVADGSRVSACCSSRCRGIAVQKVAVQFFLPSSSFIWSTSILEKDQSSRVFSSTPVFIHDWLTVILYPLLVHLIFFNCNCIKNGFRKSSPLLHSRYVLLSNRYLANENSMVFLDNLLI